MVRARSQLDGYPPLLFRYAVDLEAREGERQRVPRPGEDAAEDELRGPARQSGCELGEGGEADVGDDEVEVPLDRAHGCARGRDGVLDTVAAGGGGGGGGGLAVRRARG